MNPVKVYVVAAEGSAELLRSFRWDENRYPQLVHQHVPRGLLSLSEEADGTAHAVWYSTLDNYLLLPDGVTRIAPTEEELEAAKEHIAASCVKAAVHVGNYKQVAKVFLSRHRNARMEPTEFDAICAAATEEAAAM